MPDRVEAGEVGEFRTHWPALLAAFGGVALGLTTSPTLYAFVFDRTGSYRPALLASGAILLASAAILTAAPRRPAWSPRK